MVSSSGLILKIGLTSFCFSYQSATGSGTRQLIRYSAIYYHKKRGRVSFAPTIYKMTSEIMLEKFSDFMSKTVGMYFPKNKWYELERGICLTYSDFGFKDEESCIRWLLTTQLTKEQIEKLASNFSIGETYFFRDINVFELLEKQIIPDIINKRQKKEKYLRIWSAGCSTGEEPYSIAILLNRIIPNLKEWNITIIGTDINPRSIKKAEEGIYTEWSFRDAPLWTEQYFIQTNKSFEIIPEIKNIVTFFTHNLADETYCNIIKDMDIIFCRNVLMYFSSQNINNSVLNFYNCLTENGWFIVSPVEAPYIQNTKFIKKLFKETSIYKKETNVFENIKPKSEPVFLVSRKKKDNGISEFEEAIKLYENGKYEETVEKIIKYISEKNNKNTQAIILLSHAYANQGKLNDALKWCEKAIESDKINPTCYYLHGTILQEKGQFENAIDSLKKALYIDQNFVLAHFGLGNLNRQQGKFEESQRHFKIALLLLEKCNYTQILPDSGGITAGRLSEIITTSMKRKEELS